MLHNFLAILSINLSQLIYVHILEVEKSYVKERTIPWVERLKEVMQVFGNGDLVPEQLTAIHHLVSFVETRLAVIAYDVCERWPRSIDFILCRSSPISTPVSASTASATSILAEISITAPSNRILLRDPLDGAELREKIPHQLFGVKSGYIRN